MKSLALLFFSLLALNSPFAAFAQGGSSGNGGDSREIELKAMMFKLDRFINLPRVKINFQELNLKEFSQLVEKVQISVVDEVLTDRKGRVRTAKNLYFSGKPALFFNRKELDAYTKGDPYIYVLLFHEILNLMGVELTNDLETLEISSIYPVSVKILKVASEIDQVKLANRDFSHYQISCIDQSTIQRDEHYALLIDPAGNTVLRSVPHPMYRADDSPAARRYNAQLEKKTQNESRVIFRGVLEGFHLEEITRVDHLIKIRNTKFFRSEFLKISGLISIENELTGRLSGQITIGEANQAGILMSSSLLQFACSAILPKP